jgi:hypothetical protein
VNGILYQFGDSEMDVDNTTPYPAFVFTRLGPSGGFLQVCVVRATFEIVEFGEVIQSKEQSPVLLADTHYGDPQGSSMREESDLVPWKRCSDIYFVDPVAVAPQRRPAKEWDVHLRVGDLELSLRVTGPRCWRRTITGGWRLSEPVATSEVPLVFERSYGGWSQGRQGRTPYRGNPVGTGFIADSPDRTLEGIAAPQVELLGDPVTDIARPIGVAALTPVGRSWEPRSLRAGTFDEEWRTKYWPLLPKDFDAAYYNCAPEYLQYPGYLMGDEHVVLSGLNPDGIAFRLPGRQSPILLMAGGPGLVYTASFKLDTLVIDPSKRRLNLVWRAAFRTPGPVIASRLVLSE